MSLLSVQKLSVAYGTRPIFTDISFELNAGDWLMLVGPNGAGKSTLVKAIVGAVPCEGRIEYLGDDLRRLNPRALARNIGLLAQNHYVGYAFTVREVVRLGRYAYGGRGGDPEAGAKVTQALKRTGMEALADKSVLRLSGGELQRVFLAQLFAQDPKLILLDEPTNHLDLIYQKQVFSLIDQWRRQPGRAVISVVHDLSLARAYGTRALLLNDGRAIQGPMDAVFAPETLNAAYGMDVAAWMKTLLSQWP